MSIFYHMSLAPNMWQAACGILIEELDGREMEIIQIIMFVYLVWQGRT
jgi:hypothetical protein